MGDAIAYGLLVLGFTASMLAVVLGMGLVVWLGWHSCRWALGRSNAFEE
jgi:hypothetical protein